MDHTNTANTPTSTNTLSTILTDAEKEVRIAVSDLFLDCELQEWKSNHIARTLHRLNTSLATANTPENIDAGLITPYNGMMEAYTVRNSCMEEMRLSTSPLGLIIAKLWKPAARPVEYYLGKYSKRGLENALINYQRTKPASVSSPDWAYALKKEVTLWIATTLVAELGMLASYGVLGTPGAVIGSIVGDAYMSSILAEMIF
ncbi:hypothetical protein F5884DRAFT_860576 [Xylogone sp. PMI_703]|nr:hypothetical protein F5884DRAFT_860576 [Xylogone sp. PMI_703]